MPIYQLSDKLVFPSVHEAEEGILAIGGDLSAERLLLAYRSGIFPWYSDYEPIVWWCPDPRFILFPDQLKIKRSMAQFIRNTEMKVSLDTSFKAVIMACAKQKREGQAGTWITGEMSEAYIQLHHEGYAHSVEVWNKDELVGGLYGVSLGRLFFGESMFFTKSNASKFAFVILVELLKQKDFLLVDCQVETRHLQSLGAVHIPRDEFMTKLQVGLESSTVKGKWTSWMDGHPHSYRG